MRATTLISVLLTPLAAVAVPVDADVPSLVTRQRGMKAPPPCVMDATVTEEQTAARFEKFADAFIVKKNITEAFEYIAASYIVRHP